MEDSPHLSLINISRVLAHSLVYEQAAAYPYCEDCRNSGDDPPPSTRESTAVVLKALQDSLPGLLQTIAAETPTLERAQTEAALQFQPILSALQTRLYGENAPRLAEVDRGIGRGNTFSQAATERDILRGPGGQTVREADRLSRKIDPEYFDTRKIASEGIGDIFKNLDFSGGLSGGERTELERFSNQSDLGKGTFGTGSPLGTLETASRFGGAAEAKKQQNITQGINALGVGNQFLGTSRSVDPLQTAVGRASVPASGLQNFLGFQQGAGKSTQDVSRDFLGGITSLRQQENELDASRRDTLDRFTELQGSVNC